MITMITTRHLDNNPTFSHLMNTSVTSKHAAVIQDIIMYAT